MIEKLRERLGDWKSHTVVYGIVLYTVIWLFCAALILIIFRVSGKTFLWAADGGDGVYQHFASFQYLCDYLREVFSDFHFQGFFNYTLGQGMDVLTTLNSYDFTDPISVFCAILFPLSEVSRYTLMIFIKLYLIGISFLFYCHATEHNSVTPTVAGAVAYTFSGAVLFMFARHPNFINWAYLFPLLLGGVELYFRKSRKIPLILFVFLNVITSFYTFYMNVILVVIYVFVFEICKVIRDRELATLKTELIRCLKLAGVCLIGVLLSACIFIPTIYAYLHNNRIGEIVGYTASMLHYQFSYYAYEFESLFAPYRGAYGAYIGLNIALIIPLLMIFTKRGQYTEIKSLFIVSVVMLCIPLAGLIMNGFGYVTNRWVYVLPFYASLIFVAMFPELKAMSGKEQAFIFLTATGYLILCLIAEQIYPDDLWFDTIEVMFVVLVIVWLVIHFQFRFCNQVLVTVVIFGACFQIVYTFSDVGGNYVDTFLDESKVTSSFTDYSSTAVADLGDEDFYRVEMKENRTNVNGYNHVNGTDFWWSMVPQNVMDYYTGMELSSVPQNCYVFGLDGRTALMELASVKYYTRPVEETRMVPYGYEEISSLDEKYQIYENKWALPVGYTYTSYIIAAEFQEMNGIEKEQALLQSVVLEDELEEFETADISADYEILDYTITEQKGMIWEDGQIEISSDKAEAEIHTDIPDGYEIYVYLTGAKLENDDGKLTVKVSRTNGDGVLQDSGDLTNRNFSWPTLQENMIFNLGYGYIGDNLITLSFNDVATVYYDDIQVVAVPVSVYEEYSEKLGEYILEDAVVGDDKINGTISLPEKRILQFSVPYSEGWRAYVDGEEVPVLKSDIMYMAIPLTAGEHTVELDYETPGLRFGFMVTIVTAVLFVLYEIIQRRRLKGA